MKIGVGPRWVYSPTSLLMVFLVGLILEYVVFGPNSAFKQSTYPINVPESPHFGCVRHSRETETTSLKSRMTSTLSRF